MHHRLVRALLVASALCPLPALAAAPDSPLVPAATDAATDAAADTTAAAPDQQQVGDDVVVTGVQSRDVASSATKGSAPLAQTPQSVSVVTAADIKVD